MRKPKLNQKKVINILFILLFIHLIIGPIIKTTIYYLTPTVREVPYDPLDSSTKYFTITLNKDPLIKSLAVSFETSLKLTTYALFGAYFISLLLLLPSLILKFHIEIYSLAIIFFSTFGAYIGYKIFKQLKSTNKTERLILSYLIAALVSAIPGIFGFPPIFLLN